MTILNLKPRTAQAVYIYELPVRLWHWTMAACIFTLFVTGYYIEHPPFAIHMDTIIKVHYTAGLILCVAMACRLIWAFFGNVVSRQIFIVKIWEKSWWQGLWENLKWYAFCTDKPDVRLGHNPLAQVAMFFIVLVIFFMCFSGLGIYQAKMATPIIGRFHFMENFIYWAGGNDLDLVVLHRLGMSLIVCFVTIHVYMVIRESIMGRTTMIYTMVTGNRLVMDQPAITRWMVRDAKKMEKKAGFKATSPAVQNLIDCALEVFAPLPHTSANAKNEKESAEETPVKHG